MIVEGCRVNLRDRRDEETYDIPRLKSPISRRIYEPLATQKVARKLTSAHKLQKISLTLNDTVNRAAKIPRRSRRISRSLKMTKNQSQRELLQIPSHPFPRFGVHSCPGRGRQTLCQQFNNEILSEHLQKVKSAHSVEDFRKLLERINTNGEIIKQPSDNVHVVECESHHQQNILVPQRGNPPNRGAAAAKYPRSKRRISDEEGKYVEEWITKIATNCYDEGFQAHLKYLEECTTRLTKKELYPQREKSPASVTTSGSACGYRISVKIHGSHLTKNEQHREANLIETFTRLDISRGNAPPPQIVLNDDFTNCSVDFARGEHFTSSRHSREGSYPPDVGESLKTLRVPSLLKIAVEERPTHSRKFSR